MIVVIISSLQSSEAATHDIAIRHVQPSLGNLNFVNYFEKKQQHQEWIKHQYRRMSDRLDLPKWRFSNLILCEIKSLIITSNS